MVKQEVIIRYYINGKLDESRKFVTGIYGDPELSVFLDDEHVGRVIAGHTGTFQIDNQAHVILFDLRYAERIVTKSFAIPANPYPDLIPLRYIYNVRVDDRKGVGTVMDALLTFSATSLLAGTNAGSRAAVSSLYDMTIEEDTMQKKANDEEIDIKLQVDSIIKKILEKETENRDYSSLGFLSEKCRNSSYYKSMVMTIIRTVLSDSVRSYCENIWDARVIATYISNLSTIPEYKAAVNHMLKNKDYFCPIGGNINDGAIESILPADDPISALEKMEAKELPVLKETLLKDYKAIEAANNSDRIKILQAAIRLILRSDYEKDDLDTLKKWLLFFGAFREGAGSSDAATYKALLTANQNVFHPIYHVGDNCKVGKTVDMLIAEAMRCSRSNSFAEYDKDLEEFLKYTCPFRGVAKSQYDILLKVFKHLGAFNEERMVLQAMVDNMIERTPEQEARLVFLRDNYVPKKSVEEFKVADNSFESGQFVYEYRTLNWSNQDINDFFVSHSAQGKFDSDISYVVAEWSKTINSSIKWDIDAVAGRIDQELQENYDDRFMVNRVRSGVNSEWVEYVNSIYIAEKDAYKKEYRWLQFNVIGENITKKQITIMVQAHYWPGVDSNVLSLSDVYGQNAAAAKKICALKEKQNPRWAVFIDSVVNIVVGEIEKWINSAGITNIY